MGAQPTRRFDGEPETDADRRFLDLRESGYTGPIDQDGRKVIDDDAAAILRCLAERCGETIDW